MEGLRIVVVSLLWPASRPPVEQNMLGVRREGVTERTLKGWSNCCDLHAVVKAECDRLLPSIQAV